MARITPTVGTDGADTLLGGAQPDLIYGYDPGGLQARVGTISAVRVATGLSAPLFATAPPGDPSRLFVVEKGGRIVVLDLATGVVRAQPFLDLSDQVDARGEQGLLGLAFHPGFAGNGLFYVNLINGRGDTEIRRYQADPAAALADPASAQLVLAVDQPEGFTNHKGGWLGFGPDGFLYASLGDGGGSGDPSNNAQNLDSLLGKILRLDVNADGFPGDPNRAYAIPPDNPFAAGPGADEVWAYGLRNPWRASFDRGTGDLFIGDVGQGRWEEIDLGAAGANYGWRSFEGPAVFSLVTPPNGTPTPPIHAYGRESGSAVTGGYVYRGESEGLHGQYLFADFGSGRFWTLTPSGGGWTVTERTGQLRLDAGTIDRPTSFGEDGRGNLYVTDYDGEVFRLTPQVASNDQSDWIQLGEGDDTAFGGAGGFDTLLGEGGADRLYGQSGDDLIVGGPGDDWLDGGEGRDVFQFLAGFGHDAVVDFVPGAGGDVLQFVGGIFPDATAMLLSSRQDGRDVVITADPLNTVRLHDVQLASLTAHNLAFS